MNVRYVTWLVFLTGIALLGGCSGGNQLTVGNIKSDQSVRLILKNGDSENVLIIGKTGDEITYVSEAEHEVRTIPVENVRRVEPLNTYYDNLAYPISTAEIEKYQTNHNMFGYALGGAVIGGATGLGIGLPFWLADVGGVPPYFVAGAGAVVGSIYFAFRGQEKDKEIAIQKIRYLRKNERQLKEELEEEKTQLRELEEEKRKLREKLKEKRKTEEENKKARGSK